MSPDLHPAPINHLASSLSQCLHQLKSATTSAAATITTTTTTLNDLPDKVLLHILGYLPSSKEEIQASLISRRWRNLWLRLPYLLFPKTYNLNLDINQTIKDYATFFHTTLVLPSPRVSQEVRH
ncbi:hypothetical protein Tsubulata_042266 [Turnera subulata]|uniref:F-box domain-containing protein n=1 Tax=Turnera subulata TaxID=218843 RepID=A0A9Q0JN06_9ROSI|nr:hypothetical protein Tsubulata_042266 [Turnera subulata]